MGNNPGGGPVMYPLILCSLLSLTVIIERSLFWIAIEGNRNQKFLDKTFWWPKLVTGNVYAG